MTRTRRGTAGAFLVAAVAWLAVALAATDAGADWLVLEDGSRVETEGAWEVKGRQIVFRTADGTLSSLKTDQVDLDASREATRAAVERAARPAAAPPAAEPKPETPRRKFTNADIPRGALLPEPAVPLAEGAVSEASAGELPGAQPPTDPDGQDPSDQDLAGSVGPEGAAGGPPADEPPAAAAAGGRSTEDVVVTAWDRRPLASGDGLQIAGTLRNDRSGTMASSVEVEVVLYDRSGQRIAAVAATVEPSSIPDGGNADFVATFADVFDFGAVRFNASSRALDQGQGRPAGATIPNI